MDVLNVAVECQSHFVNVFEVQWFYVHVLEIGGDSFLLLDLMLTQQTLFIVKDEGVAQFNAFVCLVVGCLHLTISDSWGFNCWSGVNTFT